jgi:microcystin-dependent protein
MSEPFMAEIKIISWNFAPKGWAFCNGQQLPINQNQALFSLLGTTYGGNGQTTFALPNLQGRTPIHESNSHTLGEAAGQSAHTVSQSEMPTHQHLLQASSVNGNTVIPTTGLLARSLNELYQARGGNLTTMDPTSVSAVGGSQPHINMQPYLVLNFIIALQGIFPSRN